MNKRAAGMWRGNLRALCLLAAAIVLLPVIVWAQWGTSGDDIYTTNSGNVGIGITNPAARLYVAGGSWGSVGNANQNSYALGAQSIAAEYSIYSYGSICSHNSHGACGGTGGVVIGTDNPYAAANIPTVGVTFFNNGYNVGIGTNDPSTKLHVVGDVAVTGNIAAKYQDIAEWVPASQPVAAGTVVILDPSEPNTVMPSGEPYDTRVAGVVSAMPGIVLGEAGARKVKIATTGRVKVRVDATASAVSIGDLLVTSDKPGVAMRSEPVEVNGRKLHMPGTLIGKALEPLAEGEGEILVLLSLQ